MVSACTDTTDDTLTKGSDEIAARIQFQGDAEAKEEDPSPMSPTTADSLPENPSLIFYILMIGLGSVAPLTMEIYLPSLPEIVQVFDTTISNASLTISYYTFSYGLVQLLVGPLSDVYGRRRILIGGILLYNLSSAISGFAPSIHALQLIRIVQAWGTAACMIMSQAVVRDLYPDNKQRAGIMSWVALCRSAAPLLAPIIGSFLQTLFGWRSTFMFLALYGAWILLQSIVSLDESLPVEKRQDKISISNMYQGMKLVLGHRYYMSYAVPTAIHFCGLFCYIAVGTYVLQVFFEVPSAIYGLLYSTCFSAAILGSYASSRIPGFKPNQVFKLGLWISFVSALVNAIVMVLAFYGAPKDVCRQRCLASQIILQVSTFCFTLGFCLSLVPAQVQALEPFAERAGEAAGWLGGLRMAFVSSMTWFLGIVHDGTPIPMSLAMLSMGVLGLVVHYVMLPPSRAATCPYEGYKPSEEDVEVMIDNQDTAIADMDKQASLSSRDVAN